MPRTDPRDVTCLEEAFDLTTPDIRQWELELIWAAVDLGLVEFPHHAARAAEDDAVPIKEILRVLRDGRARSKDVENMRKRQMGINFEGKIRGGRCIRAKVSWFRGYFIVTVHRL